MTAGSGHQEIGHLLSMTGVAAQNTVDLLKHSAIHQLAAGWVQIVSFVLMPCVIQIPGPFQNNRACPDIRNGAGICLQQLLHFHKAVIIPAAISHHRNQVRMPALDFQKLFQAFQRRSHGFFNEYMLPCLQRGNGKFGVVSR